MSRWAVRRPGIGGECSINSPRVWAHAACYPPERADEIWARPRYLRARQERLIAEATAKEQLRDLLERA
jgi:transposase